MALSILGGSRLVGACFVACTAGTACRVVGIVVEFRLAGTARGAAGVRVGLTWGSWGWVLSLLRTGRVGSCSSFPSVSRRVRRARRFSSWAVFLAFWWWSHESHRSAGVHHVVRVHIVVRWSPERPFAHDVLRRGDLLTALGGSAGFGLAAVLRLLVDDGREDGWKNEG